MPLPRPAQYSVFGDHGERGFLPSTERYTTDLERAARFPVAASPLAEVFDGNVVCIADVLTDARFVRSRDEVQRTAQRSSIVVPLPVGRRVIGALAAESRIANAYDPVHVE